MALYLGWIAFKTAWVDVGKRRVNMKRTAILKQDIINARPLLRQLSALLASKLGKSQLNQLLHKMRKGFFNGAGCGKGL
jgi:hypothetical protein